MMFSKCSWNLSLVSWTRHCWCICTDNGGVESWGNHWIFWEGWYAYWSHHFWEQNPLLLHDVLHCCDRSKKGVARRLSFDNVFSLSAAIWMLHLPSSLAVSAVCLSGQLWCCLWAYTHSMCQWLVMSNLFKLVILTGKMASPPSLLSEPGWSDKPMFWASFLALSSGHGGEQRAKVDCSDTRGMPNCTAALVL